jgi:glycolate oxidase FAD binding subunit
VRPQFVAEPASTEEASALLRAAAQLGLSVVPRGGGTRLDWGLPPRQCDLVVDTRRLDQVLEHAAGDLVARVQAGVRLDRLREVLGTASQRLAVDPPAAIPPGSANGAARPADSGTVGGLIATGVAGPLRLRYGSPRDLLIGVTLVRADGIVARAGGKVVKNVAGYDIGKLLAGSYGTLGLITEATFRLHPRPRAAAYISLASPPGSAGDAAAALLAVAGSPLAPVAAELDWPGQDAPVSIAVALEGDAESVAERAALMHNLLRDQPAGSAAAPEISDQPPGWWGRGPAAAGAGTVLRIAFWAGQLGTVLAAVRAAAGSTGLDPAVGGSAAAGVLHAALPATAPAAAVRRFVDGLRGALAGGRPGPAAVTPAGPAPGSAGPPSRASVVVLTAPPGLRGELDMWGPVPAAGLMRAVKDQFDPEHRMSPGRFAGGI